MPAQAYVGQFLATFKDYPQRQKAASFNLDEVMSKLSDSTLIEVAGPGETPHEVALSKLHSDRGLAMISRRTLLSLLPARAALPAARRPSLKADPLPSWNDGPAKTSIVAFVAKVTRPGSPDFVPPAERIATFDNDGTLWCEQPMPVQLYFALDRVKALAPQHPEWKTKEPFASLLKGDVKTALAGGDHAILELIMATHAGMTTEEFEQIVKDWIATAKHPKTGRLFTDMVYQPMLELLAYLRANGFKNFIVSGGGIEFMRPWTERRSTASRRNRSSAAASRRSSKCATASRCSCACRS